MAISGGGSGAARYYYHLDGHGSIIALSDLNGDISERHGYDAYGVGGNNSGSAFQFAGRRIDFETGLYYNRARYYSPTTGRFLSPDPLGYGGGLNLYAYVGNDPVDFADPSGLAVDDAEQTGLKAWEVNTTRSSFGKSSFYIGLGKGGVQFVADNLQLAYIASNPQQYLIDKVLGNPTLNISDATANLLGPPADDTERVARLDAQVLLSFAGAKGLGALGRAAEEAAPALTKGGTYVLRNLAGDVMRVGRTNNLVRREAEHALDPILKDFRFDPIHRTDSYAEQRGLEQMLHDVYDPPLDKINPISPRNSNYDSYMGAANRYLDRTGE
jgi:RHS repeat-associated protein